MGQVHGVTPDTRVTADAAAQVARIMGALATASRVRILARLREGSCTVGELTATVEMAQPAVSHQLRVLRDLGLVVGDREGRHIVYGLYDSHVASLLDEALRHIEHLHAAAEAPTRTDRDDTTTEARSTMSEEHTHTEPHAHEHEHDGDSHVHVHTEHDHEHVEHEHDHDHDGDAHTHPHMHEAGLEDAHEHDHAS